MQMTGSTEKSEPHFYVRHSLVSWIVQYMLGQITQSFMHLPLLLPCREYIVLQVSSAFLTQALESLINTTGKLQMYLSRLHRGLI